MSDNKINLGIPSIPLRGYKEGFGASLVILGLIGGIIVTVIFLIIMFGNERVPAGYAGYIYSKPVFGKNEFKGILTGPDSTGIVWRQSAILVSVTPYTYTESFQNDTSVLAKDKLALTSRASIVWRLNTERVKQFIEHYGGLETRESPDSLAKEAYKNFIMEPFRTEVRNVLSRYNALDVSSNLGEISRAVEVQLRERLKDTPFVIDSAVVGETAPPRSIVEAVEMKVAKTQEMERKVTELEIAKREIEIQKAQGEAQAQLAVAKAKGDAEAEVTRAKGTAEAEAAIGEGRARAIRAMEQALGKNYIMYSGLENLKTASKVYLPIGPNGFPVIGTLPMEEKK